MGMAVLATLTVLKDGGARPGNAPGEIFLIVVILIIIGIINAPPRTA